MADTRCKMPTLQSVVFFPTSKRGAFLAVLMDIRDELRLINGTLQCSNFREMPHVLKTISRKIPVRPRKKAKK